LKKTLGKSGFVRKKKQALQDISKRGRASEEKMMNQDHLKTVYLDFSHLFTY